jgi:hypothetical protein
METLEKQVDVDAEIDQWDHNEGKRPDSDHDYVEITYEEGKHNFPEYQHVCHAVIWAANKDKIFDQFETRGSVMVSGGTQVFYDTLYA